MERVISRDDILWLAGYLEGEGSFHVTNSSAGIIASLKTTDEDIAKKVGAIWGSPIQGPYPGSHNGKLGKDFFNTRVTGGRAAAWMMTLYKFMGKRRKLQIIECIRSWKLIPQNPSAISRLWRDAREEQRLFNRYLEIINQE